MKKTTKLGICSLTLFSMALPILINEDRASAMTGQVEGAKSASNNLNKEDDANLVISKASTFVNVDGTYQTSYEGVAQLSVASDKVQVTIVDSEGMDISHKTYSSKNGEALLSISEKKLKTITKPNKIIFTIEDSAGNVLVTKEKEVELFTNVSATIDSAISRTVDGSNSLQIKGSASLGEKSNRLVMDILDANGLSLTTRTWTGDSNLNLTVSSIYLDFPSAKSVSFTILDSLGRKLTQTQKDFSFEEVNTNIAITSATSIIIDNQTFYKVTGAVDRVSLLDTVHVSIYDKENHLIKEYKPKSSSNLLIPIDIDDSVENVQPYKVEVSVLNINGIEKAKKELLFN